MSDDAVSFHYVTPGEMYIFDYLLYRLKRHQTASSTTAADLRRALISMVPMTAAPSLTSAPVNFTRNKLSDHKQ